MAIYKCIVCGNIYDEEKEKLPLSQLEHCPVCKQPLEKMINISVSRGRKIYKGKSLTKIYPMILTMSGRIAAVGI